MLKFLLLLVAPGAQLPPDGSQYALSCEGLGLAWALFFFAILAAALAWSYRKFAPTIGPRARVGLTILRGILLALLLLLLVHPVLLITIEESVRQPLLVLIDMTQSMGLSDTRTGDDLARAALAKGVIDPAQGLNQPFTPTDELKKMTRSQLLEALASNPKLDLWPRLYAKADLHIYGFGRKLVDLGLMKPRDGHKLTRDDSTAFFHALQPTDDLTSLGDGLRDLLDQQRGQPIAGILVITDGANNNGAPPMDAAVIAQQDGVPLYLYGVGVAAPRDIMVAELAGPQVSNIKEKLTMTARIRAQGMLGKKATILLKANGKIVDEEAIEFRADGEQEISLGYTPTALGDVQLEATVPPLPEEAVTTNNTATAKVRIVDDKIRVLLVEQLPRWDFQYLLAMLQRDRRIKVKCVVLKGDAGLADSPDSPFLDRLPEDKETLMSNDIVILGDVDSSRLGDTRMKILNDWVNKAGGAIVFLAGPKFNPYSYPGTPLEGLLPVEPGSDPGKRYDHPVQLKLSAAGENSPLLTLSDNPQENLSLWDKFPGVQWTAWVGKARPGAQVLLVDPTPERAIHNNPMPVMAIEGYGQGQVLYIGMQETYRWRSKQGEKYYTQIWGQIIQGLSTQRTTGASRRTQLKTDRPRYLTGDHVKISGRILRANFEPQTDPEVVGTYTLKPAAAPNQPAPKPQTAELRLQAVPDRPGEYRGEMIAQVAGDYSFSTLQDPNAVLKFDVTEPRIELADIAMNEKLLRSMAKASGGEFFREENLDRLPGMIASKEATDNGTLKKIPLVFAPTLLGLIIVVACAEWIWRRKLELK